MLRIDVCIYQSQLTWQQIHRGGLEALAVIQTIEKSKKKFKRLIDASKYPYFSKPQTFEHNLSVSGRKKNRESADDAHGGDDSGI